MTGPGPAPISPAAAALRAKCRSALEATDPQPTTVLQVREVINIVCEDVDQRIVQQLGDHYGAITGTARGDIAFALHRERAARAAQGETLAERVERWMETGQRVELGFATGDGVYGRGKVFAYSDQPTCFVRLDNGREKGWVAHLLRETDRPARDADTPTGQARIVAESVDLRNPDWRTDLRGDIEGALSGTEIVELPSDHPAAVLLDNMPGDRDHTPSSAYSDRAGRPRGSAPEVIDEVRRVLIGAGHHLSGPLTLSGDVDRALVEQADSASHAAFTRIAAALRPGADGWTAADVVAWAEEASDNRSLLASREKLLQQAETFEAELIAVDEALAKAGATPAIDRIDAIRALVDQRDALGADLVRVDTALAAAADEHIVDAAERVRLERDTDRAASKSLARRVAWLQGDRDLIDPDDPVATERSDGNDDPGELRNLAGEMHRWAPNLDALAVRDRLFALARRLDTPAPVVDTHIFDANTVWGPGGYVCAGCRAPVQSAPCWEHQPDAVAAMRVADWMKGLDPGDADGPSAAVLTDIEIVVAAARAEAFRSGEFARGYSAAQETGAASFAPEHVELRDMCRQLATAVDAKRPLVISDVLAHVLRKLTPATEREATDRRRLAAAFAATPCVLAGSSRGETPTWITPGEKSAETLADVAVRALATPAESEAGDEGPITRHSAPGRFEVSTEDGQVVVSDEMPDLDDDHVEVARRLLDEAGMPGGWYGLSTNEGPTNPDHINYAPAWLAATPGDDRGRELDGDVAVVERALRHADLSTREVEAVRAVLRAARVDSPTVRANYGPGEERLRADLRRYGAARCVLASACGLDLDHETDEDGAAEVTGILAVAQWMQAEQLAAALGLDVDSVVAGGDIDAANADRIAALRALAAPAGDCARCGHDHQGQRRPNEECLVQEGLTDLCPCPGFVVATPPAPEGDTKTVLTRARAEHDADHLGLSTPWCPWCYPPNDPTHPPAPEGGWEEDDEQPRAPFVAWSPFWGVVVFSPGEDETEPDVWRRLDGSTLSERPDDLRAVPTVPPAPESEAGEQWIADESGESDEGYDHVAFAGGDHPDGAAIMQSFAMDRAAAEEKARWLVEGGVARRRGPAWGPWELIDGWQDPDGESRLVGQAPAEADSHAEGTGETEQSWWLGWYGAGSFEYHGPWWVSGAELGGAQRSTFVAAVRASSEDQARRVIADAHDAAEPDIEWRFVEARADSWDPFGSDRFPRAAWMQWPASSDAEAADGGAS